MHTYIDESGLFAIPASDEKPAVSCCGALVVPSATHDEICAEFQEISSKWVLKNGEIKGGRLNEEEFDVALKFLVDKGCLFSGVVMDTSLHTEEEVEAHRVLTKQGYRKNLPVSREKELETQIIILEEKLSGISLQLYTQMLMMIELVWNNINSTIRWFDLFNREEFTSFSWVIDAKDHKITDMEWLWNSCIRHWLEAKCINAATGKYHDENYAALPRNDLFKNIPLPKVLAQEHQNPGMRINVLDLNHIIPAVAFKSSKEVVGLQMVDLVVNATRRALTGRLKPEGWKHLGSLIVKPADEQAEVLTLMHLGQRSNRHDNPEYSKILIQLRSAAIVPPSASV